MTQTQTTQPLFTNTTPSLSSHHVLDHNKIDQCNNGNRSRIMGQECVNHGKSTSGNHSYVGDQIEKPRCQAKKQGMLDTDDGQGNDIGDSEDQNNDHHSSDIRTGYIGCLVDDSRSLLYPLRITFFDKLQYKIPKLIPINQQKDGISNYDDKIKKIHSQ